MRDLPQGWAWATLGEATERHIESSGPQTDSFTYLDITSIDVGSKQVTEPKTMARTDAPGRARQNVRNADVLVALTRPNRNAVAILGEDYDGAVASTAFHVLRALEGVEPEWLYYLVQANHFVETMSGRVQGALYPAIRSSDVTQYRFPLPPPPEQSRIVAEIERYLTAGEMADRAISAARIRMPRTLASAIRSALKDVWSGPETSQQHTGWNWVRFGDVLESLRNGVATKPDSDSGQPILKISAVRPMVIRLGERRYLERSHDCETYRLQSGDLLFTRYNGNPELVGVCAAVPEIEETLIYPDKLIRARLKPGFHPPYFEIALNYGVSRRWLRSRVRTSAGQCGISGGDLKQMPVPVPQLEVQHAIADAVGSIVSSLRHLDTELARISIRSTCLRQSILKAAFEGKLVPQGPNDESASVLLERIRAAPPSVKRACAIR